LQALAEPNSVVIAPETHRLIGSLFEYRDLGAQILKGFERPVPVRQVLRVSAIENRFEARHQEIITPLLGREEELDLLLRRWENAKRGEGGVVLVTGEAGIGKSRLTRALQARLPAEPYTRIIYHCSPYHQDSPLYPVIGQLVRGAGIEREDTAEVKLNKLASLIGPSSTRVEEDLPLFGALLSISGSNRFPLPKMTPQQLRASTVRALITQLQRLCDYQPVLILFEDLHWIDPTSLELMSRVVERAGNMKLLLLATARPRFVAPWPNHRYVTTLPLSRLDRTQGKALVESVAGGKGLPADVLDQILSRTDGVPLFIEELTKSVLESGLLRERADRFELNGPILPLAIPSTLHASLLARLDRFPSAKAAAQIGAAIGREFSYGLIAAVAAMPERQLRSALNQLAAAELLFRHGQTPDERFQFKHALVQEAAYSSLLRSRREQLHGEIGRVVEQLFPDIVASEPEIVANHFTLAGLTDTAIQYWRKAGELALRRSAIVEAVNHLTRGIELIKLLPPSPERDRKELDLYLPLSPAMSAMKGFAAPETVRVMSRARALLGSSGSLAEQMSVLSGLYLVHYMNGPDFEKALGVAQQCLTLATGHKHTEAIAQANRFIGQALWARGELVQARRHLEECIRLSGDANPNELRFSLSNNGLGALSFLALVLQLLGCFDESAAAVAQALKLSSDPLTRGQAIIADVLRLALGANPQRAIATAEDLLAHSLKYSLAYFEQWARFHQGALLAERGDPRNGIDVMNKAMSDAHNIGCDLFVPMHLGLLSVAQTQIGDLPGARRSLDDGIQAAAKSLERFYEPEQPARLQV
jgi:tetratricopeptide (TPR) repeat protein